MDAPTTPASPSWIHADIVGGQVKVQVNDVPPPVFSAAIGEQLAMLSAHLVRLSGGILTAEEAMQSVLRSVEEIAMRRVAVHLG